MSRCRTVPFAFASLVLLSVAVAQRGGGRPPAETPPAEPRAPRAEIAVGKDGFVLPMGEVAVEDLIDGAARYLGRNILWQPQEIANAGTFVFQKPLAVDALGCEEVVYALLASRDLAVVPVDEKKNLYEIVNLNGPRARDAHDNPIWRTPEEILQRPNLKQIVLTSVSLQHVNATVATNALRPFFAQMGNNNVGGLTIGNVGTNDALLLQGYASNVAAAIRLLRACDRPMKERDLETWQMSQAIASLQAAVGDLQGKLATAQQQIVALQKAAGTAAPQQQPQPVPTPAKSNGD